MSRSIFVAAVVVVICAASLAYAFSTGPPDGRTGAPGESNCTVLCHSTSMLNSGAGILQLGAPSTYTPGATISVTVDLSLAGQMRWGFECTVLDSNDLPVGQMVITDPARTQLSIDGITGRQYVKHTSPGTDPGTPNIAPGWSFDWIAPAADAGPVTFWCAGNAANGNLLNTGDFIYTTMLSVSPAPEPITFNFPIDEAQANAGAGTGSPATGTGMAVLNGAQTELTIHIEHSVSPTTAAHIHMGAPGVNGGVRFGFSSPVSPIDAIWPISPADVSELLAGNLYVNIHSSAFPGGEIRGQIVDTPPAGCCDQNGDSNDDGAVDIADLTYTVDFMFKGGADPVCPDEGDINGDCALDIADLTYRVSFMFSGGPGPTPCQTCVL